eukprot:CAMPEP_0183309448 /NCGR_PEP_ID=MMETSP0160_2-20130417/25349_1 /TAXON_ID=2839 ORGANISM="Odontella Sinensis, Strain Grunow 1884" /NCGR_SAMPLE_ID=MMETSP0160_2 /ASSEMBLY_ACC=CAM_ASM_000250 /LENGTH=205 /DNA_ID=CAMNT_0025473477 /DNA_START=20 /DNA_END=634 /DNA_ORIENTATION=-
MTRSEVPRFAPDEVSPEEEYDTNDGEGIPGLAEQAPQEAEGEDHNDKAAFPPRPRSTAAAADPLFGPLRQPSLTGGGSAPTMRGDPEFDPDASLSASSSRPLVPEVDNDIEGPSNLESDSDERSAETGPARSSEPSVISALTWRSHNGMDAAGGEREAVDREEEHEREEDGQTAAVVMTATLHETVPRRENGVSAAEERLRVMMR